MKSRLNKADAEVARTLIAAARSSMAAGMRKIQHCAAQLSDEQLWWRPAAEMNSIANLVLHLAGNIRQWIVSGIGGHKDSRNRPAEFADRSNRSKDDLLAVLGAAVGDADRIMAGLSGEQFLERRRIQGFDTTVLEAIFSCVPHFHGHAQEIIHMTRRQLGPRYRFDFVPSGKEQESAGGTGA
jgi:hypothetical protein